MIRGCISRVVIERLGWAKSITRVRMCMCMCMCVWTPTRGAHVEAQDGSVGPAHGLAAHPAPLVKGREVPKHSKKSVSELMN